MVFLVQHSAAGFYGTSNTSTFNDDSPSGNDYLSQVSQFVQVLMRATIHCRETRKGDSGDLLPFW